MPTETNRQQRKRYERHSRNKPDRPSVGFRICCNIKTLKLVYTLWQTLKTAVCAYVVNTVSQYNHNSYKQHDFLIEKKKTQPTSSHFLTPPPRLYPPRTWRMSKKAVEQL